MTTVPTKLDAHKVGWLDGITDLLNGLDGVRPMLGHGTGYDGPFPDELGDWISEVRDRVAVMREHLA